MATIIVVGGSLGGLFAANILRRQGHDVVVLEKSVHPLDGRGAGIVTHSTLFDALKLAGVSVDETIGVEVEKRVVLGQRGERIGELKWPQILTSWSRLYQLLKQCLPAQQYLQGKAVKNVTQDSDQVYVECEDGSQFRGDLLIASDGLRSVLRQSLAPSVQPNYAGYIAWRGVCDEAKLSQHTIDTLFNHFGFCLPDGEQMLGYPVAGRNNDTRVGYRWYNFVWYRPISEGTLTDYLTDEAGVFYAQGIPPAKIRTALIDEMRTASRQVLAPQYAEIIEKTEQPFFQAIYDIQSDKIAFGRIALMGDASFVARPHVGMGVTKAGDDVMSLARHIDREGASAKAILAYQQERLQTNQSIVARAQYLGRYMQAQISKNQQNNDAVTRNAETVMKETAIDLNQLGITTTLT